MSNVKWKEKSVAPSTYEFSTHLSNCSAIKSWRNFSLQDCMKANATQVSMNKEKYDTNKSKKVIILTLM